MWRTSGSPYYSISRPQKDERLSWPCWLTYSGRFIHISGHTSATGRAWDRGSSLVKDRRSTTVQSGQRTRASKQATFHNLVAKYVYLCKNRKLHCELRYTRFDTLCGQCLSGNARSGVTTRGAVRQLPQGAWRRGAP